LLAGGKAAIGQPAAVHGLGGVGKTRLALEYAHAHRADYAARLFVIGDSAEALKANLAALSGPLALNLPGMAGQPQEAQIAAVLGWLAAHPGWLVILDNIDSDAAMAEAKKLLPHLDAGHVLITSRRATFSAAIRPLELDVLAPEDARDFLLARTEGRRKRGDDDAAQAEALARELGGLALALEQAAALIARRRLSLAAYLADWRANSATLAKQRGADSDSPHALAATFHLSMRELPVEAQELMHILSFFAPEPIPEAIFDAVKEEHRDNQRAALDACADLSLAQRLPENNSFAVHRLVQQMLRNGLDAESRKGALEAALAWINGAYVGKNSDVRNWPRLLPLAPHVAALTAEADRAGVAEPTSRLMNDLAQLYVTRAQHALAEPLMRRALAIDEARFGPDHPEVATGLNNLAGLFNTANRLAEAEPMVRRALAIDEARFGPDHPEVAIRLNNLATLLRATNRLAEAELLYRRVLTIFEASLGPEHPNVATVLNNLGGLLRATNRLAEAEPLYRRALAMDETSYGPDHPEVATDLNNLAALLQAANRLAEAEPLVRRVVTIFEVSLGPEHPNVATALNNLAALLEATNRLAEAEPLYRRALAIDETSYGPDHPTVATDLNNLAGLLEATNRLAEAESLYRRAVTILLAFTRDTGHPHPHLMTALNNHDGLLIALGRTPEQARGEIEALAGEVMAGGA
jgi:tetratricopeptide (TPR) repeat protein